MGIREFESLKLPTAEHQTLQPNSKYFPSSDLPLRSHTPAIQFKSPRPAAPEENPHSRTTSTSVIPQQRSERSRCQRKARGGSIRDTREPRRPWRVETWSLTLAGGQLGEETRGSALSSISTFRLKFPRELAPFTVLPPSPHPAAPPYRAQRGDGGPWPSHPADETNN